MSNFPRGQQSTWYWVEAKNDEDNVVVKTEEASSSQPAIKIEEQSVPMDVQSSEHESIKTFKEEDETTEIFEEHPKMSCVWGLGVPKSHIFKGRKRVRGGAVHHPPR